MKLTTVAMFGAGYVLGTRAGHQRYEQLREAARRVAGEFDVASIRSGLETVTARLEQYAGGARRRQQQREPGPWPGQALTGRSDPPGAVVGPSPWAATVTGRSTEQPSSRPLCTPGCSGCGCSRSTPGWSSRRRQLEPTSLDLVTSAAVDSGTGRPPPPSVDGGVSRARELLAEGTHTLARAAGPA
jgi:hypothetical protein